ncbi:MAG TPA: YetF domain-containing protein [Verrucomicrobiae bacterium]|nr:YetF domain-containing protein [Verrucomicrobiae bacterium]
MDSILKGAAVYVFLLLIFRIAGKRTLSQTTTFDLVLLLIISETTQQAMVDNDHSITNGILLITTLVGMTILLSVLKQKFPKLDLALEGAPLILIDQGKLLRDRMEKCRVDESEILSAARMTQGLVAIDQIQYAILERNGDISIIPKGEK